MMDSELVRRGTGCPGYAGKRQGISKRVSAVTVIERLRIVTYLVVPDDGIQEDKRRVGVVGRNIVLYIDMGSITVVVGVPG